MTSADGATELDARLRELVADHFSGPDRRYLRRLAASALGLGVDRAERVDLKLASAALEEMRRAFRLFTPHRHTRKATVFGSARTPPEEPDYGRAVAYGRLMAESGWMVVTGAGSGIMGAAHEGAGREMSFGVNIQLPFEQHANETVRDDPKLLEFRYFFTRKLFLLKESSAIVLFPGGFGTLDECFEVLTLLQTGKQTPLPVVMVERPEHGYFRALAEFLESRVLGAGLISPADRSLFRIVGSPEEARDEVLAFYRVYHSSRYVDEQLFFRLERELSTKEIESLNDRFSDIVKRGRIEAARPLAEDEGTELHRPGALRMDFDRRSFGRLRQLVDAVNELGR